MPENVTQNLERHLVAICFSSATVLSLHPWPVHAGSLLRLFNLLVYCHAFQRGVVLLEL